MKKPLSFFFPLLVAAILGGYSRRRKEFLDARKPTDFEKGLFAEKDDAKIVSYTSSLDADGQREFRRTKKVSDDKESLSDRGLAEHYISSLGKLLAIIAYVTNDKVATKLGVPEKDEHGKEKKTSEKAKEIWTAIRITKTFTPKSYEFCLKIALLYPVLFLVLNWLFSGEIVVGDILFVEQAIWYERITTVLFLVLTVCLFLFFLLIRPARRLVFLFGAFLAAIIGTFSGLVAQGSPAGFSLAIAGACFGILIGFACARGFRKTVESKQLLVSLVGCTSWIGAIFFVICSAKLAGLGDDSTLFIGCVSSAIFVYILTGILYSDYINPELKSLHWIIFNCLFFPSVIFLIMIVFSPAPRLDENYNWVGESSAYKHIIGEKIALPLLIPLFFSVLPVVNAVADWLSLNVTRKLLFGVYKHHDNIKLSLAVLIFDLLLAIVFIFLVASLMVLFVSFLNVLSYSQLDGTIIINFKKVMVDVTTESGSMQSIWMHAMIVSTLAPTVLHFLCVIYAVVVWPISHWGVNDIDLFWDKDDVRMRVFHRLFLARWISLCLACFLLYSVCFVIYEWWNIPARILWQWLDVLLSWVDPVYAL